MARQFDDVVQGIKSLHFSDHALFRMPDADLAQSIHQNLPRAVDVFGERGVQGV